jgi:hypothetical protein
LDFALGINMARLDHIAAPGMKRPISTIGPKKGKGIYHGRTSKARQESVAASSDLLKKYEYQYQQRLQCESEEEEYERRSGKSLKKREDTRDHWHCLFFKYCWDSGMSRLPTTKDCPECGSQKHDAEGVSVFQRFGPVPP